MTAAGFANPPRPTFELVVGSITALIPLAIFAGELSRRPPPRPEGWVLLFLVAATLALAGWLALRYLRYQRTVKLGRDSIEVTCWWDAWRGVEGECIASADIQRIVLRRPAFCDVETAGGRIRFGTMFWHRAQERELDALARAAGLQFEVTG